MRGGKVNKWAWIVGALVALVVVTLVCRGLGIVDTNGFR